MTDNADNFIVSRAEIDATSPSMQSPSNIIVTPTKEQDVGKRSKKARIDRMTALIVQYSCSLEAAIMTTTLSRQLKGEEPYHGSSNERPNDNIVASSSVASTRRQSKLQAKYSIASSSAAPVSGQSSSFSIQAESQFLLNQISSIDKQIKDVNTTMDDVEVQIRTLQDKLALNVANNLPTEDIKKDLDYYRQEKSDLRQEKSQLLDQKYMLLQASLTGPVQPPAMNDDSLNTAKSAVEESQFDGSVDGFLSFVQTLLPNKSHKLKEYQPLTLVSWADNPFQLDNLKDRSESLTSAYRSLNSRIVKRKRGSHTTNRFNNHLIGTQGAPGSGKSSFLDRLMMKSSFEEIAKAQNFDDDFVRQFEQVLPIAITFNSSSNFIPLLERDIDMNLSIGIRILYYYFCGLYRSGTKPSWHVWLQKCLNWNNGRTHLNILGALSIVRKHRGRVKESVLLLIDELMKVGNDNVAPAITAIGSVMDEDGDFHVVLSTLNMLYVNATCTNRVIDWVHLPSISFHSMQELFKNIRDLYNDNYMQYNLDWGIAACAGHPRTLEYFYRFVSQSEALNISFFPKWENFKQMFKLPQASVDNVIKTALQGISYAQTETLPVNIYQENRFDALVERGYFLNTFLLDDQKYVPRIVPWHLVRSDNRHVRQFLQCYSSPTEEFKFNHYERFHAWWEVVALWADRLKRFVTEKESSVQILKMYQPQSTDDMRSLSGSFNNSSSRKKGYYMSVADLKNRYLLQDFSIQDKVTIHDWKDWGPHVVPSLKQNGVIVTDSKKSIYSEQILDEYQLPITVEQLLNSVILSGYLTNPGCDCFTVERLAGGRFVLIARELKFSDPKTRQQNISKEEVLEKYQFLLKCLAPHLDGGSLFGKSTLGQLNLTLNDVYLIVVSMRDSFTSFVVNDHCIALNRQIMELAYTPSLVTLPSFMVMNKNMLA